MENLELKILGRILPLFRQTGDVAVGPGDDCAAVDFDEDTLLLLAADQVIAGVHYDPATASPEAVGAKLLKRNLSDIAAMGGEPCWALCTIAQQAVPEEWLCRFFAGLQECAAGYGVAVVGGDFASLPSPGVVASLTIVGKVKRETVCLRKNARPGDMVYVTGEFGNSLRSGHHLTFEPRLAEGRFLAGHGFSCCMMDVSDGLLLDLSRLASASRADVLLEPSAVPLRQGADTAMALGDGEDYELIFTVPPQSAESLEQQWPADLAPLHRIGRIVPGEGTVRDAAGGGLAAYGKTGYVH